MNLARLELDPGMRLRRHPPRPVHLRPPGYGHEFDDLTVFYDCFASTGGQWVVLIGPALANLEHTVIPLVKAGFGKPAPSDFIVRNLDRHSQVWVRATETQLDLPAELFMQQRIFTQPSHCDLFQGKKVVLTKSKNNDLRWIRDWAAFYARKHGCNAVLFYDNASTRYAGREVREALQSVPGLDVVVVLDWPYKFGPQGRESGIWDSDFCQYGIMEHARHRFLSLAEAVVNADVDELVITEDGASIYELVRQSRTGYLSYRGIWIENACAEEIRTERTHADFIYTSNLPALSKWAVAPQRCPVQRQWRVHDICGMLTDPELSGRVCYRHFRALNTGWRGERWVPERPGAQHVVDEKLVEWMGSACLDQRTTNSQSELCAPPRRS